MPDLRYLNEVIVILSLTLADIFDHILAVVPEFDLRVYQNPTGNDFRAFQGRANA